MSDLPPPDPRQPPTESQPPAPDHWQQPAPGQWQQGQSHWQQGQDQWQQPAPGQWQQGQSHWQQQQGQPPAMAYAGTANPFDDETTPILVTGILSLVLCGPVGIYAWIKGNSLRDRARAAGWPEPSTGKVGRILGIVGTVIAAIQVGFLVLWLFLALGIMGAAVSGT